MMSWSPWTRVSSWRQSKNAGCPRLVPCPQDVNEKAQNSTDEDAPVGRYNRTHCGTNEGYVLADPASQT